MLGGMPGIRELDRLRIAASIEPPFVVGEPSRLHARQRVPSGPPMGMKEFLAPIDSNGIFLLRYDLRPGLGNAASYEISLNFEFLLRAQIHHGIEGQVAG